jgi:multidrug efflux pump subunit AcrB
VSREKQESGGQTLVIFALGLLFVFLVLAAQYESFVLPFVVVLSVPLAVLGAATRTRRSRTRVELRPAVAVNKT